MTMDDNAAIAGEGKEPAEGVTPPDAWDGPRAVRRVKSIAIIALAAAAASLILTTCSLLARAAGALP